MVSMVERVPTTTTRRNDVEHFSGNGVINNVGTCATNRNLKLLSNNWQVMRPE